MERGEKKCLVPEAHMKIEKKSENFPSEPTTTEKKIKITLITRDALSIETGIRVSQSAGSTRTQKCNGFSEHCVNMNARDAQDGGECMTFPSPRLHGMKEGVETSGYKEGRSGVDRSH
jgi:hypothetical protein